MVYVLTLEGNDPARGYNSGSQPYVVGGCNSFMLYPFAQKYARTEPYTSRTSYESGFINRDYLNN